MGNYNRFNNTKIKTQIPLNQGVQGSIPLRRTKDTVFADVGAAGTVFFFVDRK